MQMKHEDMALLHVVAHWVMARGLPVNKDRIILACSLKVRPDGAIAPRPSKRQMQLILLLTDYWSRVRRHHALDPNLWLERTTFSDTAMSTELEKFNHELASLGGGKRESGLFVGYVIDSHGYVLRYFDDVLNMYCQNEIAETKASGTT